MKIAYVRAASVKRRFSTRCSPRFAYSSVANRGSPQRGEVLLRSLAAAELREGQADDAQRIAGQLLLAGALDRGLGVGQLAGRQLAREDRHEYVERGLVVRLAVLRPAVLVLGRLEERRRAAEVEHVLVLDRGLVELADLEQHLGAAEVRVVDVLGLRIILDQTRERLLGLARLADVLVRARQLVQHTVVARRLRELRQHAVVQLDRAALARRALLERAGVLLVELQVQVRQAAHGLGARSRILRQAEQLLVVLQRQLRAGGNLSGLHYRHRVLRLLVLRRNHLLDRGAFVDGGGAGRQQRDRQQGQAQAQSQARHGASCCDLRS
jgi:hypothetical protein